MNTDEYKDMTIAQTKPTIVNKITAYNLDAVSNKFSFWMVSKDGNWSIHYNSSWKHLSITDSSKFFKNGETKNYTTTGKHSIVSENDHVDCLNRIIAALKDGHEFNHELLEREMSNISTVKNKSIDAFNPFSTSHIKPFVFKGSKKFRRDDVVKIIVNQQFERIQIDSKYTDDYLYDAEQNFFRDVELVPMKFLKDYIDLYDPTVYIDDEGKKVTIYYGSSTYSITLK